LLISTITIIEFADRSIPDFALRPKNVLLLANLFRVFWQLAQEKDKFREWAPKQASMPLWGFLINLTRYKKLELQQNFERMRQAIRNKVLLPSVQASQMLVIFDRQTLILGKCLGFPGITDIPAPLMLNKTLVTYHFPQKFFDFGLRGIPIENYRISLGLNIFTGQIVNLTDDTALQREGGGTAIFLRLTGPDLSSTWLYSPTTKQTRMVLPSFYLNSHGEEDIGLNSGFPLFFNQARLDRIVMMFITGEWISKMRPEVFVGRRELIEELEEEED
jgi:hypothetical protein